MNQQLASSVRFFFNKMLTVQMPKLQFGLHFFVLQQNKPLPLVHLLQEYTFRAKIPRKSIVSF